MILDNDKRIDEKIKGAMQPENAEKILIVDDEKDIRKLVGIYLKRQGYQILEAENGKQAIDLVRENSDIDLIIMDVMMPVMDGLEATKAIRMLEREDAKKIPIIAMTANAFEEDRKACLEAGMNEHIGKPIDIPRLKRAITKLLTKKG